MKAEIDRSGCIGCGLCAGTCPEVFEMDTDGLAKVILEEIPEASQDAAVEASEGCPVGVISVG